MRTREPHRGHSRLVHYSNNVIKSGPVFNQPNVQIWDCNSALTLYDQTNRIKLRTAYKIGPHTQLCTRGQVVMCAV